MIIFHQLNIFARWTKENSWSLTFPMAYYTCSGHKNLSFQLPGNCERTYFPQINEPNLVKIAHFWTVCYPPESSPCAIWTCEGWFLGVTFNSESLFFSRLWQKMLFLRLRSIGSLFQTTFTTSNFDEIQKFLKPARST